MSTKTSKIFADRLSDLIEEKRQEGVDYRQISEKTKIPTGSLSNYVNDSQQPNISRLATIANYFSVSADWLLGLSDVKNQSMDIKMIVESTGLSEESVMALCLTQTLSSLYLSHENLDGNIQTLETEVKERLHLDKYPLADLSLLSVCFHFKSLINDIIKAITSDEGILFDYGSLRSTSPTIDNFDGSFDPEFQKQLAERGFTSLPAPQYVKFLSAELAKKMDRYFIEKYGRGYY